MKIFEFMNWMMLGNSSGAGDSLTIGGLCLLLTALAAFVARVTGVAKGKREAQDVTLTNVPLRVEMEKEFVRREEWLAWRGEVRSDLTKLEGMMERTFDRIDVKHKELLDTIERSAKTGVDGRVALWNELRDQNTRLARTEAQTDVARGIKDLAVELKETRVPARK